MQIAEILRKARRIAIVGLSPDPEKDSHRVAHYLMENGFEIYPIYPKEEQILWRRVYRNLSQISEPIDIVVMFRKGEFALNLIHEVISCKASTLWLQLGITNDEAGEIARANGVNFVQDRCIKIELQRLKNGKFK